MTVRRADWRAAFLADLVLAMGGRIYAFVNEIAAYRGTRPQRQRRRLLSAKSIAKSRRPSGSWRPWLGDPPGSDCIIAGDHGRAVHYWKRRERRFDPPPLRFAVI